MWRWLKRFSGIKETHAEKHLRIMSAPIKKEGYGPIERFFNNFWARWVWRLRVYILLGFLMVMLVQTIFSLRVLRLAEQEVCPAAAQAVLGHPTLLLRFHPPQDCRQPFASKSQRK